MFSGIVEEMGAGAFPKHGPHFWFEADEAKDLQEMWLEVEPRGKDD